MASDDNWDDESGDDDGGEEQPPIMSADISTKTYHADPLTAPLNDVVSTEQIVTFQGLGNAAWDADGVCVCFQNKFIYSVSVCLDYMDW